MADENLKFQTTKTNEKRNLKNFYDDEESTRRRYNKSGVTSTLRNTMQNRDQVIKLLEDAFTSTNHDRIANISEKLYDTNPVYMNLINYYVNMFDFKYKLTPRQIFKNSKAKYNKPIDNDTFGYEYRYLMELIDGVHIETTFPFLLKKIFVDGGVYITTFLNEEVLSLNTILLPYKYCRAIGQTQYQTKIIQFDYSYFTSLGLTGDKLKEYIQSFPVEMQKQYNKYTKDVINCRWQTLDARFSTGILLNPKAIPTFLYVLGGILNYEKYQDNQLQLSDQLLEYLVVHTIPHYEDKLIFETDEVKELQNSLKRKIEGPNKNAKVITTYGDVHTEQLSEDSESQANALAKAYSTVYNNLGLNSNLFTSDSVTALKMSLIKDQSFVWEFIQLILNFYTIAVNNWSTTKNLLADIDILRISQYTYNDDIGAYKESATLGVGKIDYIIARGIKQKNIQDNLKLENFLGLDEIKPMQTSYTQSTEDREDSPTEIDAESNNQTTSGDTTTTQDNNSDSADE